MKYRPIAPLRFSSKCRPWPTCSITPVCDIFGGRHLLPNLGGAIQDVIFLNFRWCFTTCFLNSQVCCLVETYLIYVFYCTCLCHVWSLTLLLNLVLEITGRNNKLANLVHFVKHRPIAPPRFSSKCRPWPTCSITPVCGIFGVRHLLSNLVLT